MSENLILVVDDEPDLTWVIQRKLERSDYKVLTAHNGLEALAVARRHYPALIVLDINMPVLDGLETCKRVRKDPTLATIPILLLSEKQEIQTQVEGLDHGADDYITKPFDLGDFLARIRALLRRSQLFSNPCADGDGIQSSTLVVDEVSLDLNTGIVNARGKTSDLTPIEIDLLYFLMTHPQELFTSRQLLQLVWNYPDEINNAGLVRWHIMNLRNKIEIDPKCPNHIITVAHQGYMFKTNCTTKSSS
jgi:DNA-binding response OmpR family regulator